MAQVLKFKIVICLHQESTLNHNLIQQLYFNNLATFNLFFKMAFLAFVDELFGFFINLVLLTSALRGNKVWPVQQVHFLD